MKIEHLAIWVRDLEKMKAFYEKYFHATANDKYFNPNKNFYSYFLSFEGECRLEIMQMPNIPDNKNDIYQQYRGIIHFAISLGSKEKLDALTKQLRTDFEIVGEPRTMGDGYYESIILDPENNRIEITN